ncbi:hypothetical protein ACJZ2D_012610 [Fusarium nematophilum]
MLSPVTLFRYPQVLPNWFCSDCWALRRPWSPRPTLALLPRCIQAALTGLFYRVEAPHLQDAASHGFQDGTSSAPTAGTPRRRAPKDSIPSNPRLLLRARMERVETGEGRDADPHQGAHSHPAPESERPGAWAYDYRPRGGHGLSYHPRPTSHPRELVPTENRRSRVRQKVLEHVAAVAMLSSTATVAADESLQQVIGTRPRHAPSLGNLSNPPGSLTKGCCRNCSNSPSPLRVAPRVPSNVLEKPAAEDSSFLILQSMTQRPPSHVSS